MKTWQVQTLSMPKEIQMLSRAYRKVRDKIQYYLDYFYWRKRIKQNVPDIDDLWLKHSAEFHAETFDRNATMKPKYQRIYQNDLGSYEETKDKED